MKKYQNVLAQRNRAEFVEVLERDGIELLVTSKKSTVKRGLVSAEFSAGRINLTKPVLVPSLTDASVSDQFASSLNLSFNVPAADVTVLTAYKAEVDRVFALIHANMLHGIVPAAADTLAE